MGTLAAFILITILGVSTAEAAPVSVESMSCSDALSYFYNSERVELYIGDSGDTRFFSRESCFGQRYTITTTDQRACLVVSECENSELAPSGLPPGGFDPPRGSR